MGQHSPAKRTGARGPLRKMTNAQVKKQLKENELNQIQKLAQQHSEEAFNVLVGLMRDAESEPVRRAAAESVIAWGYGKPAQQATDRGPADSVVNITIVRFGEEPDPQEGFIDVEAEAVAEIAEVAGKG
jgi:hypothetical protein